MKKLVIIGAGGHGKVVADIAAKNGYTNITFLDDNDAVKTCGDYIVVGTSKEAVKYTDADFFVAIGNATRRRKIQSDIVTAGLHVVSLFHPNSVIAPHVKIGGGTVVMAGVVINPYTEIGQGCIINTCASIDHDTNIADYVHVSVGSHIAGTVKIGKETLIGAGAVVSNNVHICERCVVGAGAVVVKDIEKRGTYVGVPARLKERDNERTDNSKNVGGGGISPNQEKY